MPVTQNTSRSTAVPTKLFIQWLRAHTEKNKGKLPGFSNPEAAVVMGLGDRRKYGQFQGNVQSRIDFACYLCNFPPIGLGADEAFDGAWAPGESGWKAPVAEMICAVKGRVWRPEDFTTLESTLDELPPGAAKLWRDEMSISFDKIKLWAYSLVPSDESSVTVKNNPKWGRDELMLALHLYIHNRQSPPGKSSVQVAELSRLLNKMANTSAKTKTYRNAAGVYMKLMNFRSIDPVYTAEGKLGLKQGSKDDKIVWDLFVNRLAHLDSAVANLKEIINAGSVMIGINEDDEPEIEDCEEGRIFTRMHRFRERNRKLVADFKERSRKQHGLLKCGACDLDFANKYGPIADRLIDVHHTKPVHTLKPGDTTSPKDLVLLCASCHRAVHSGKQWLSVSELRSRLGKS